uniref:Uncharacterized protein n=1 Tax=Arundo donax TaxID=35708 RepID=A0A0A9CZJ1_ARUDO
MAIQKGKTQVERGLNSQLYQSTFSPHNKIKWQDSVMVRRQILMLNQFIKGWGM